MPEAERVKFAIGQRLQVNIEKIAHGGHFIARHEGAVIFVRYAALGEECIIEITGIGSSLIRADAIEIISPSPDRVSAPCRYAHPGGCGGCDFQHISLPAQRAMKAQVIQDQFKRIAKVDISIAVEEVGAALGWRTRCTAVSNRSGELGFYSARSHKIIPVDDCRILANELKYSELVAHGVKADQQIEISLSNTGERTIATSSLSEKAPLRLSSGPEVAHYVVGERTLEVSQKSFWQSHKDAPRILSEAAIEMAGAQAGEDMLDLYGGVGLFTAAFIDLIGPTGRIDIVEGGKSATADARRNFADSPQVHIHTGDVAQILPRFSRADLILLDPPREGAGKTVTQLCAELSPTRILYIACDPAALARDTGYLQGFGYTLEKVRAFDLFPMTHHIEAIALFTPSKVS